MSVLSRFTISGATVVAAALFAFVSAGAFAAEGSEQDTSIAEDFGCGRWGARAVSERPVESPKPGMRETRLASANRSDGDLGCPRGCACGRHGSAGQGRRGRGRGMNGHGPSGDMRGGMGPGMGRGHRALMESVWTLVDGHDAIERTVEEIPEGVRTVTMSKDPELVPVLRKHVREMADLIENGGRIRMWDPLFAELFEHTEEIEMEIEEIDGGVVVTETSKNPEVAKLIRAHADKVLEFVARGDEAYREETPLPKDYSPAGR